MPTRRWRGEDIAATQASQARCRTEVIEEALYHHPRSLSGALSVAFFDTTSLYFEGRGGATLGRRGYSKDFRPQLHQVVLGIVLDENDRPTASLLWPGNTADVTTLLPVVERLRSRFGVSRACVVADRGMISAATIAGLEAPGIDYRATAASCSAMATGPTRNSPAPNRERHPQRWPFAGATCVGAFTI
jgi:Transposase DDE domain